MKKIIIKIIIGFFLFFGLNNLSFASIAPFSDIDGVSYDGTNVTLSNNGHIHTFRPSFDISSCYFKQGKMLCMNNNNTKALTFIVTSDGHYYKNYFIGRVFSTPISYDVTGYMMCVDLFLEDGPAYNYSSNISTGFIGDFGSCKNLSFDGFNYNNSAPLLDGQYIINGVLYGGGGGSSNQVCKEVFTSDENKFNYKYKSEYTTFIDYLDEDKGDAHFQYGYEENKFLVSLKNAEHITNFSGAIINDGTFSYDNYDTPFSEASILKLNSTYGVNYFELNGTGSYYQKVYGLDKNGDRLDILEDVENIPGKNFEFNKLYYFPYIDNLYGFEIETTTNSFSDSIEVNVDFGKIVKTQEVHQVCYDEGTNENITVDDESYTGSLDKIGQLDIENLDRSDSTNINFISGTGGLENSFTLFNDKFGNTFDNLDKNLSFSGVEQKLSIIKDNIDNRLNLNENKTCEMFNDDGSFKSYGTLDISLNFNILQGNSFDYLLIVPQKFINFATNPINNLLSLTSVFENLKDNQEICFLGFKEKVEFQKIFKKVNEGVKIPNMNNDNVIIIGEPTIIDYFVLIVFGIIFVFGMITVFSRLY